MRVHVNHLNTPTTNNYIRPLEPEHAERMLGVRIPAAAQMKTNFEFRPIQPRELAARILRASLIQTEAEALYRHVIPITSYCLPIVIFDINRSIN